MRRTALLTLAALATTLALAAGAQAAKYSTTVGIGDQSPAMFTDSHFSSLKVKKVRYFIHWDAAKHPDQLAAADAYVAAARLAHASVLMHISTNNLARKSGKLPSTAAYKSAVRKLITRYKAKGVKDWGVWNEANNQTEETWNHPGAAAKFFLTMRSICSGCHIVALDVLDQAGVQNYIRKFFAALGRKNYSKAAIVGIHNYSDVNRYRSTGTALILKTVRKYARKASFWLTETGGVASFGANFPCNTTRQNKAEKYMFTLVRKYHRDIKRLYTYAYFGVPDEQCQAGDFDAGIVTADGAKVRPTYTTFKTQARSFAR